jgi:hypothetical protein
VVGHGPGCTDQFPVGTRVTSIPIRLIDGGVGGTRIIGQHPEAQGSFGELLVIAEMLARQVDRDVSLDADHRPSERHRGERGDGEFGRGGRSDGECR